MRRISNYIVTLLCTFITIFSDAEANFFEDLVSDQSYQPESAISPSESRWIEDQFIDGHGQRNPLLAYQRGKLIDTQPLSINVQERSYRSTGTKNEKFIIHPDLEQTFLSMAKDPIYAGIQVVLDEQESVEALIYVASLPKSIKYQTKKVTSYEIRTYELLAAPILLKFSGPYTKVGIVNQKRKRKGTTEYLTRLDIRK